MGAAGSTNANALGRGPASFRRLSLAVGAGWALLSVSAIASHDPAGAGRAAIVAGLVLTVLALARSRAARVGMSLALAAYVVVVTGWTILAGAVPGNAGDDLRMALFTGNPNDLAASLVAAGTAWLAAARRSAWWAWMWPALAIAVIYTGSRTAGGALLAAFVAWVVLLGSRTRARAIVAIAVAALATATVALGWQYGIVQRTPNLLGSPNDLGGHDWHHRLAASVEVVEDAAPGPFEGTRAQRLIARAQPGGRSLVFQSVGRSESGVPYVASLYLRSDTPQRIVVSSHLARTTCAVGPEWRRCVTPVETGDDYLQAQFYLLTAERGGTVDVLVYGAQYEIGTSATAFRGGRPEWIPQTVVRRFDLRRLDPLPADRVAIWRAGLRVAREHIWFGVGLPASETILLDRTQDVLARGVTYAHNLLVHLLLVHGVVGLVGSLAIGASLLAHASRRGWARIAPLLVSLALLNTWDLTIFEPEVALPVIVGLALGGAPGPWTRGSDRQAASAAAQQP